MIDIDTVQLSATIPNQPELAGALFYQMEGLPSFKAPFGCKAWRSPGFKNSNFITYCIKLQYHNITGELNTTQTGLDKMKATVTNWLDLVGLTIDDFQISRIDYDYNFYLPLAVSEVLIDTMQQLPYRAMHMNKADFPQSVYYLCKSRHAQLYRKDKERKEKGFAVRRFEEGLVRQEVQCHSAHIRYQLRHYGLARAWCNWVSLEREEYYLTNAKPIFTEGDFCSFDKAKAIIQGEQNLKPLNKKRLIDAISQVQGEGMAAFKEAHSINTVKKYLGQLAALNINLLTIKPNLWGVDFIANPFYSVQPKGGAAV